MKILVLNYEYPPIGGGGGIISKHISEGLARLGNEVTVVTTQFERREEKEPRRGDISLAPDVNPGPDANPGNMVGSCENDGPFRIIRLKARRKNAFQSNPLEMVSWIRITKKFLGSWGEIPTFDICFAHFVLPGGEVARYIKKKFSIPYVVMSHGHDIPWVHPRQMFFFHLATFPWIRHILKKSKCNLLQTTMMKANADRFLGSRWSGRNMIVPNGVAPEFKPDYSKRGRKLRILFIGRLVIQKDPMTFLKALKLFSGYTLDFEVHVLGDGHLRKNMEQYCRKNKLNNQVLFKGKIHPEEMVAEYQSAHLMIAPSLNEGMSIAALEALSSGVYLIATKASGYPDMITEGINGTQVEFRDPAGLAEAIRDYYRSKFLANSRLDNDFLAQFQQSFSWLGINQQYNDVLLKKTNEIS